MSPVIRSSAVSARPAAAPGKASLLQKASSQRIDVSGKGRQRRVPGANAIVNKELPGFSRQLAAMLSAGMPIVSSLTALQEQIGNPNFKVVISHLRQRIENGASFSEVLKEYPSVFDDLYVNMVRGGETGGQMAETIARIAEFLENRAKLRRKVRSAMSYPIAVMCIATVLATLMVLFIVPVFKEMYSQFGGTLPGPTRMLMAISDGIKYNLPIVVPAIVVVVIVFRKWKRTRKGQIILAALYLRLPVVGVLVQKIAMARFARTFGQLIHSGVPILTALDITAGATGNKIVEIAVRDGQQTVERGDPLSACLATKKCFTAVLVHMLAAGEKTGRVDEMMDSVADLYEDEVDAMLSGLTALIEPLLMVFLGVVIGGIVVCMFLPIFKLHELVSG